MKESVIEGNECMWSNIFTCSLIDHLRNRMCQKKSINLFYNEAGRLFVLHADYSQYGHGRQSYRFFSKKMQTNIVSRNWSQFLDAWRIVFAIFDIVCIDLFILLITLFNSHWTLLFGHCDKYLTDELNWINWIKFSKTKLN